MYAFLEADVLDSVRISIIAGSSYGMVTNPEWESASSIRPKLVRGSDAHITAVDSKSGTDPAYAHVRVEKWPER